MNDRFAIPGPGSHQFSRGFDSSDPFIPERHISMPDTLSSLVCRCILSSVCAYSFFHRIVSELQQVVGEYVKQLLGMYFVPPFSFGRGLYRDDGGPNRLFFTYLFCDKSNTIECGDNPQAYQRPFLGLSWAPTQIYLRGPFWDPAQHQAESKLTNHRRHTNTADQIKGDGLDL